MGEARGVLHGVGRALLGVSECRALRRHDVVVAALDALAVLERRALCGKCLLGGLHLRLCGGVLARRVAHVAQGGEAGCYALACPTGGPCCCTCGRAGGSCGCARGFGRDLGGTVLRAFAVVLGSGGVAPGPRGLTLCVRGALLGSALLALIALAPSHGGSSRKRATWARS